MNFCLLYLVDEPYDSFLVILFTFQITMVRKQQTIIFPQISYGSCLYWSGNQ